MDSESYSLYEGIQLDSEVFSAYAEEFGRFPQENLLGTQVSMLLWGGQEELQNFHSFHTAYRYGREMRKLQEKLQKTSDPSKKQKIQQQIEKRQQSKEYQKFGQAVEKHLKKKQEEEERKKKKKKDKPAQ